MASEQRITVNGTTYDSLDGVPQPYRDSIAALMADRDGDGVPDLIQAAEGSGSPIHAHFERSEAFVIDGVSYSSIDEIPEPKRAAMRELMDGLDPATAPTRSGGPPGVASPAPSPIVTEAGPSARTKLLLAFVAVDVAVAAAVVWFLVR